MGLTQVTLVPTWVRVTTWVGTQIRLLVFHVALAFADAKSSVNLIAKENSRVSYKFTNFLRSSQLC